MVGIIIALVLRGIFILLGAARDRAVHLGLLHLRRVPGLHRDQPRPAPRRGGGLRGERASSAGCATVLPITPDFHGSKIRVDAGRQEVLDADDRRLPGPGDDRPALRARQHPGDLRAHPGAVHRLHRERLRADGAAPAVLPARRPADAAGLPLASGWPSSSRSSASSWCWRRCTRTACRSSTAASRSHCGAVHPDLAVADGHPRRARRGDGGEPAEDPGRAARGGAAGDRGGREPRSGGSASVGRHAADRPRAPAHPRRPGRVPGRPDGGRRRHPARPGRRRVPQPAVGGADRRVRAGPAADLGPPRQRAGVLAGRPLAGLPQRRAGRQARSSGCCRPPGERPAGSPTTTSARARRSGRRTRGGWPTWPGCPSRAGTARPRASAPAPSRRG